MHKALTFILLLGYSHCILAQDIGQIKDQEPVNLRGALSISTVFNQMDGIEQRRPDFSYVISGSPVISLYGVDIPVSFLLSNYQRNFKQPFNKFGISPYYKNLKVHLGYRNVRFSPFTLNGHTFLGAGVEYHPGIFRLGVVYGRFLKAIEEDPEYTIGNDLTRTPQPSFRRTAYAIKFGIGSEANHVDLVYLKGKDDENSLDEIPQIIQTYPAENAVFGISSRICLYDLWDLIQ